MRRRDDAYLRSGAPRVKPLIYLTVAAAILRPHYVLADSAVNGPSAPGNQVNTTGLLPGLLTDPRGLSELLIDMRSPTGLLYPKPYLYPPMLQDKEHPAWWHSAWADVGYLADISNTGAAAFSQYGDWSNGLVASFGFLAENRETANYVSATAGSIGRRDQFYNLTAGRYGSYRLDLSYDAVPHLLATHAKLLWNGAGTENLTLPGGLAPGATTPAQASAALAQTGNTDLNLSRSKSGLALTYTPSVTWELFLNAANEWRDGNKPLGSAFAFPGRGFSELVQPIKYRTVDLSTGTRFKGEAVQANFTYTGSFFRNDFAALTWENPGFGIPAGNFAPQKGRMALAPDNDYHTLKADVAWEQSDTRIVASAAYATMQQNGALIPPTVNNGLAPADLANWNTVAALDRKTAEAGIETINAFAQFRWNPDSDLGFTVETRYRNEDNKTDYLAFNPSTMEYGYMGLDGALSRIYAPLLPGSDVPIRNIPFENDEVKISAKADYRLLERTRLALSLAHEEIDRAHREVVHANDDILEAQLSSTGHGWGTVRLSYAYADRKGSAYVTDPYLFARSPSLPGYVPRAGGDAPYALSVFRKYDVADRREHTLKAQSNFILSGQEDLQLSGSVRSAAYDADYGLKSLGTYDVNSSYTNQISSALTFTAFYGYQLHRRNVGSINPARGATGDASAGGPNYPFSNAWNEKAHDANQALGADIGYKFEKLSLDLAYTMSLATSEFAYSFAGAGAISPTLTPLEAGTAFPDQMFEHHIFEVKLGWAFSETIALRWYYRLEHETLQDFHDTGLTNIVGNNVFLGAIPQNYTAHVLGFFTQYRF